MTPEQEKQALEAYKNECERLRRLRLPLPLWEHWTVPYRLGWEARGRASGRQGVQADVLVDSAKALIWYASSAANKLIRQKYCLPHAEVEGWLENAQAMDLWLEKANFVAMDFNAASKWLAALAASPQITSPAEQLNLTGCKARSSLLPEPPECDWPHCECDPKATRVVEALIEEGWQPPAAQPSDSVQGWKPIEKTNDVGPYLIFNPTKTGVHQFCVSALPQLHKRNGATLYRRLEPPGGT